MPATTITILFNDDHLASYTDQHLAFLWHVAQANPAPHGDKRAGEVVERIGREIIRRFVRGVEPELWHHQGRDHYWSALSGFARYEPGGPSGTPEWEQGRWVPRDHEEGE